MRAGEYYGCADALRERVLESFDSLARRFDVIVVEGAGSVSELNLRDHDLANLGLATRVGAPWLLVADIERGGVFASVIGTVQLLTPEERALFRGFAVNRFHGDVALFDDGVRILEERTGSRCFGVFPYASDVYLDAEDSLALSVRPRTVAPRGARIAIVHLPHISNATDFRLLSWADWLTTPSANQYDFVILPGSKNTIADLKWLRSVGLASWILAQHANGTGVIGICGGYQMLGRTICDPAGMESDAGSAEGLGLLPASTELTRDKQTRTVTAVTRGGVSFGAYEIHLGVTTIERSERSTPFARLEDGSGEGIWSDRLIGTYLHGALEHPQVCAELFGIEAPDALPKRDHYHRLGEWFARHARHLDELGLG
jgi:adenosylcobyric acid synthase